MTDEEVKLVEFQNIAIAEMVKAVLDEKQIPYRERRDPIQASYLVEESSAAGSYSIIYVKKDILKEAQEAINGMI